MLYVVSASESKRKKGDEFETRAIFHFLANHSDKDEMYSFVLDVFNDVTAIDRLGNRLWDLQSKGEARITPCQIGEYLVTLCKNYLSEFEFQDYILFMQGVSATVLRDSSLKTFKFSDVNQKAQSSLRSGLKSALTSREYTKFLSVSDDQIEDFLSKVTFVIDDGESYDWILGLLSGYSHLHIDSQKAKAIFVELQRKVAATKSATSVDGLVLHSPNEALSLGRDIRKGDIHNVIIMRCMAINPVRDSPPPAFRPLYDSFPADEQDEMFRKCQQTIAISLMDTNRSTDVWKFVDECIRVIEENATLGIDHLYDALDKSKVDNTLRLDAVSIKYFLALLKEKMHP